MSNKPSFRFEIQRDADIPEDILLILNEIGEYCLEAEGVEIPCAACLRFTDDAEIRKINREYRGIDRATDVLSFPSAAFCPSRTAGAAPQLLRREWDAEIKACMLGDIIISADHARMQAEEYGHSLKREIAYLTVHAMFHLMGYDHMREEDREVMRKMEEKALNKAGISRVDDDFLVEKAKEAMQFSYSPYSHFRVGACLLAADGRIFTGCNVENASYGVSNCAERTALFKAVSEGAREFTVIAIAAEKTMAWPCGICRQALNEFAPDLRVIVACGDERDEARLPELLPHSFGPSNGICEYLGKDESNDK